jgi:hypothetical protein
VLTRIAEALEVLTRIADALTKIADALTDGKTSETVAETVEVKPEVIASAPPTTEDPKPTLNELQSQVGSELLAYHKRGGDAEGLILETIEVQLKSNEMDEAQCVMILNSKIRDSSER